MKTEETTNQIANDPISMNPSTSKTPEKERNTGLRTRIKAIKKPLALAAISMMSVIGVAIVVNKGPEKYSIEWISGLSDRQWEIERKNVQAICCNPQYDVFLRKRYIILLDLFDKVKNAKDRVEHPSQGPIYHREHGRNLYKLD